MANYVFPNIPKTFQPNDTITFNYTGSVQTLNLKACNIFYGKIECYGAGSMDAKGGYAYGTLNFAQAKNKADNLYFVVGEYNTRGGGDLWGRVSFGGGGGCGSGRGNGGGASDVRTYYDPSNKSSVESRRPFSIDKGTLNLASLASRLIVAGGAGAADTGGKRRGGAANGGGWVGDGAGNAGGGTQSSGCGGDDPGGTSGFGIGGTGNGSSGAGGGGFYGGAGKDGGGGGSSYVSGNKNCPYATYSGIQLSDSGTKTGINTGHGKIVVTVLSVCSSKALYYMDHTNHQTTRIALYPRNALPQRDGLVPIMVSPNEAALAMKKMTFQIVENTDVSGMSRSFSGEDVRQLLYSYRLTATKDTTVTLHISFSVNNSYGAKGESWCWSYFYMNDNGSKELNGKSGVRRNAQNQIAINNIGQAAEVRKNDSGTDIKISFDVPIFVPANSMKVVTLCHHGHASNGDGCSVKYITPITVRFEGLYLEERLHLTKLKVERNGAQYTALQDSAEILPYLDKLKTV